MNIEPVNIKGLLNENLFKGSIFLVITNPLFIPPHVGIAVDENYTSLTLKGRDEFVSIKTLLRNAAIKQKPVVGLRINNETGLSLSQLEKMVSESFSQYDKVNPDGPTCLIPVLDFFGKAFGVKNMNIQYLFQLVPFLINKGWVEGVYATNISDAFPDSKYYLKVYDAEQLKYAFFNLLFPN